MLYTCNIRRMKQLKTSAQVVKILEVLVELDNDDYSPIDYDHVTECGRVFVECETRPTNNTRLSICWKRLTARGLCEPTRDCYKTCKAQR